MNEFLIALGANLPSGKGSPKETLEAALNVLRTEYDCIIEVSRFFRTPCFPPGAGPDYVNAAASLSVDMTPQSVIKMLHDVESLFGRERLNRWGMRCLDLDLLAFGDFVLPDLETYRRWLDLPLDRQKTETPTSLILPHPRVQDRAFVLVPLREVAADWRHPVLNRTIKEMYQALSPDDLAEIIPLDAP